MSISTWAGLWPFHQKLEQVYNKSRNVGVNGLPRGHIIRPQWLLVCIEAFLVDIKKKPDMDGFTPNSLFLNVILFYLPESTTGNGLLLKKTSLEMTDFQNDFFFNLQTKFQSISWPHLNPPSYVWHKHGINMLRQKCKHRVTFMLHFVQLVKMTPGALMHWPKCIPPW